jgi:hypothetical protein
VPYRVDEGDGGRRRRDAGRSGDAGGLFSGALGAEHEAAGRARPHHRIGFLVGELCGTVGEPLRPPEVEQGVDPVRILTDRGDHDGEPDGAADAGLQRGKIVLRAVTGVEEPDCHHAVSLFARCSM